MIIKEIVAQGATTDEAIENGCRELGVSRDDVKFEIIELAKQKTFGLFGGNPASVRVYVESDDEEEEIDYTFDSFADTVKTADETAVEPEYEEEAEAPEADGEQEAPAEAKPARKPRPEGEDTGEKAAEYLRGIIVAMGLNDINVEVIPNEDGNGATLDVTGDGLGAIIGRRGETLSALQYLVSLAANNRGEEYFRVAINIGTYREKREDSLENLARKTALRCLKINRNLALDPMNPYERRIIHTAVQEIEGASSWSVGEDSKRHVVIGPTGLDEGSDGLPVNHGRNNNGGRGGYGGNRGGYNGNRGGYNRGGSYGGGRGGYNGGGRGGYGGNRGYNNGGYQNNRYRSDEEGGYGGNRGGYGNGGSRGGYNRGGSYGGDRGYNGGSRGGYGGNRGYSNSGSRSQSSYDSTSAPREVKRDSSAPLYGRIEVPRKPEGGDEE